MIKTATIVASCVVVIPVMVSAAAPIASLISAQPFILDGRPVAAPGVTSWPVVVGDEFATDRNGPLVIHFRDGSVVKLSAASRARITGSDSRPKVVLMAGNLDFKLVQGSALSVVNLDVARKEVNLPKTEAEKDVTPIADADAPSADLVAADDKLAVAPSLEDSTDGTAVSSGATGTHSSALW